MKQMIWIYYIVKSLPEWIATRVAPELVLSSQLQQVGHISIWSGCRNLISSPDCRETGRTGHIRTPGERPRTSYPVPRNPPERSPRVRENGASPPRRSLDHRRSRHRDHSLDSHSSNLPPPQVPPHPTPPESRPLHGNPRPKEDNSTLRPGKSPVPNSHHQRSPASQLRRLLSPPTHLSHRAHPLQRTQEG